MLTWCTCNSVSSLVLNWAYSFGSRVGCSPQRAVLCLFSVRLDPALQPLITDKLRLVCLDRLVPSPDLLTIVCFTPPGMSAHVSIYLSFIWSSAGIRSWRCQSATRILRLSCGSSGFVSSLLVFLLPLARVAQLLRPHVLARTDHIQRQRRGSEQPSGGPSPCSVAYLHHKRTRCRKLGSPKPVATGAVSEVKRQVRSMIIIILIISLVCTSSINRNGALNDNTTNHDLLFRYDELETPLSRSWYAMHHKFDTCLQWLSYCHLVPSEFIRCLFQLVFAGCD